MRRRHFRHSRTTTIAGAMTCFALAAAYLSSAWWIVFDQRWGPVVGSLTPTHGLHTGDLVGVAAAGLGLLFGLFAIVLLDDGLGRRARPTPAPVWVRSSRYSPPS